MPNYFQPEIECASREELREIQSQRLREMVKRCYEKVPLYRKRFDEMGLKPEDIQTIDDLTKLPFTTKQDLRDTYPFGLVAVPRDDLARVHASSGTTGKQTVVAYTERDLDVWATSAARSIVACGGNHEDFVHVSYGYGLFTGGLGLHDGAQKMGATVIPVSSGNTNRQVQILQDYGSDILACTPSYAMYIGETVRDKGIDPKSLRLRIGIFGAEPWTEEMRREIEKALAIKAYDIYGLSEIAGPGVACECEEQNGMHVQEDFFYPEIIDPATGEQLPDGEEGGTGVHLHREGGPAPHPVPHPGHLLSHPREVRLRPHHRAHDQAQGPHRRHAHHPGHQRVPQPDRKRAAGPGYGPQLPDDRGPEEQPGHPGGAGGDERGHVLRHRAEPGAGGAYHRRRPPLHLEYRRQDHPGGPQDHRAQRGQGQACY